MSAPMHSVALLRMEYAFDGPRVRDCGHIRGDHFRGQFGGQNGVSAGLRELVAATESQRSACSEAMRPVGGLPVGLW